MPKWLNVDAAPGVNWNPSSATVSIGAPGPTATAACQPETVQAGPDATRRAIVARVRAPRGRSANRRSGGIH